MKKENFKSPINWYGGKFYMKNAICEIINRANTKTLVDGFGGSGIISLNCTNDIIIYNDIHQCLYLLFKLLRDENTRDKLIEQIQLTPYSRDEFMDCKKTWKTEVDEIEKVRKFYTSIMQSVGATGEGGWCYAKSNSRRGMSQAVSRWLGNVDDNMVNVIEKLRTMQIENLDVLELIKKYDKEDICFYLDPPYITETRKAKEVYDYEMTEKQHEELVDALLNTKGKVILSGYDHIIYNKLEENGWNKIFLGDFSKRSQRANDGQLEKGQEFLWINFSIEE